jgi:NOL1/NOP2/fmu family ribosome biogenesis protein
MRNGLLLGEVKKNRFEPSQALAMALESRQYDKVISLSADDDRVIKYLKGETIELDDYAKELQNGWNLFCVDNFPLGWGKLGGTTLKNKYLSGWRWQ